MKISIIIPIYNVAPYLQRCLDSVANQTITEGIECILVDDCGTDNSLEIAEQFVQNYQGNIKFQLISHEQNKGLSAARNTGIRYAIGEYLFFLDSDDEITPNCIEGFLDIAHKHPKIDFIQGFHKDIPSEGKINLKQLCIDRGIPEYSENKEYIKTVLLADRVISVTAHNRLIRKDIVINNNLFFKEGIIHEDSYWNFFLAKHINSFAMLIKITYLYHLTPNSIMRKPDLTKRKKAYVTMLHDFSDNVDSFLAGEQKCNILRVLTLIINEKLFESKSEKWHYINYFAKTNNWVEHVILVICFILPRKSIVYTKAINLLQRIYRYKQ